MISLYSGTPGSGKSLHVASIIYWRLRRKLPIIANFDINTKKIYKPKGKFICLDNSKLTPDYLIDYAQYYWKGKTVSENSILLVIDECQLMFNAREWNASGREKWLSFFTQHRKYGYRVILIAQFDRMIDRQIRSLIEYEFIHRKVSNYGWKGFLVSWWSFGRLFVCVEMWYPMKQKVGSEFFLAKKRYYSLYNTYNTFSSSEVEGREPSSDDEE